MDLAILRIIILIIRKMALYDDTGNIKTLKLEYYEYFVIK